MEKLDWSQIVALITVIGLYTHMVVEWIKQKAVMRQICHYLSLDEHGNPSRDKHGKVKRFIDSDIVREIVRHETNPTIKLQRPGEEDTA